MMKRTLFLLALASASLHAQVSFDRLLQTDREPHNWLTYSGGFSSQRHSSLTQITPRNVKRLELQWIFQARSLEKFEATPLVVDGVMYTVQAPNDVVALDAVTGRVHSGRTRIARRTRPAHVAAGSIAGVAILGETLFMGTIDGHLIAVDAKGGRPVWDVAIARPEAGLSRDSRSAGRQGQGHHRHGRRRVRHSRVHRGIRCQDRKGSVALLHDPRPWRARPRHVGRRFLEDRRRLDLGDRFLRSRSEPRRTGASATPGPTGTATSSPATISTATRSSLSMRIRVS